MRSLVLNIDDTIYERFINFLKIMPQNKIKVIEEIPCGDELYKDLEERKLEVERGEVIAHDEFWKSAGI